MAPDGGVLNSMNFFEASNTRIRVLLLVWEGVITKDVLSSDIRTVASIK